MSKYEKMTTAQKLQNIGLKEGSDDYEKAKNSLESGASAGLGEDKAAVLGALQRTSEGKKRVPLPSELINYKKGGKVSSASKRADGCAVRGKTKGRMV